MKTNCGPDLFCDTYFFSLPCNQHYGGQFVWQKACPRDLYKIYGINLCGRKLVPEIYIKYIVLICANILQFKYQGIKIHILNKNLS